MKRCNIYLFVFIFVVSPIYEYVTINWTQFYIKYPPPPVASQIIINQSIFQYVLVIFIFLVLTTNWFQKNIVSLMRGIIHWQKILILPHHLVSLSVRLVSSDCPISYYFVSYWLYVSLILICLSDCDCFHSFLYLTTFVIRYTHGIIKQRYTHGQMKQRNTQALN
jgi:glucose-6-phosphate-specific signal transduction histidine kinase